MAAIESLAPAPRSDAAGQRRNRAETMARLIQL
jgi:hypothetical protein